MINQFVWDYINNIDIQTSSGKEYLAEQCIKEGYGQSCGGYLANFRHTELENEKPSQKEHFLNYYKDKKSKQPSYHYLRCPQLMLFIAEIAGLSFDKLEDAYNTLRDYEDRHNLRFSSNKNGNYICGKKEFQDFKVKLHNYEVVKIIGNSENWEDVLMNTSKL